MNSRPEGAGARSCWFVGASYGGTGDQTPRLLREGILGNVYQDRHLDLVRSTQPGERIAIKSSYTRKRDLPFDNRGQTVSVMAKLLKVDGCEPDIVVLDLLRLPGLDGLEVCERIR